MRRPQRYDVSVFLNCPFDDAYRPLLHAALFAIQDCGFIARTALEDLASTARSRATATPGGTSMR